MAIPGISSPSIASSPASASTASAPPSVLVPLVLAQVDVFALQGRIPSLPVIPHASMHAPDVGPSSAPCAGLFALLVHIPLPPSQPGHFSQPILRPLRVHGLPVRRVLCPPLLRQLFALFKRGRVGLRAGVRRTQVLGPLLGFRQLGRELLLGQFGSLDASRRGAVASNGRRASRGVRGRR